MYYRIFILIALFFCGFGRLFAAELPSFYNDNDAMQKKVLQTGFKLLNANNIQKHFFFYYDTDSKIRVEQRFYTKKIIFYKGIVQIVENDDEFAALIAREIAYAMDARFGIFRRTSMGYNPRKYEIKADRRAVDYLVRAGYNPIGLITVYNKLLAEPSAFCESFLIKHKGSERILSIYDYIYQKYPYFIAHNDYLETLSYQNFLRTSKEDRKKIRLIHQARMKLLHKHNSSQNPPEIPATFDLNNYNIYNAVLEYENYDRYGLEELEEFVNSRGGED